MKSHDEWDAELSWAQQRAADNDLRARIAEDKVRELVAENARLRAGYEELRNYEGVVNAAIEWADYRGGSIAGYQSVEHALIDAVRGHQHHCTNTDTHTPGGSACR